jgi:hypothetical protein
LSRPAPVDVATMPSGARARSVPGRSRHALGAGGLGLLVVVAFAMAFARPVAAAPTQECRADESFEECVERVCVDLSPEQYRLCQAGLLSGSDDTTVETRGSDATEAPATSPAGDETTPPTDQATTEPTVRAPSSADDEGDGGGGGGGGLIIAAIVVVAVVAGVALLVRSRKAPSGPSGPVPPPIYGAPAGGPGWNPGAYPVAPPSAGAPPAPRPSPPTDAGGPFPVPGAPPAPPPPAPPDPGFAPLVPPTFSPEQTGPAPGFGFSADPGLDVLGSGPTEAVPPGSLVPPVASLRPPAPAATGGSPPPMPPAPSPAPTPAPPAPAPAVPAAPAPAPAAPADEAGGRASDDRDALVQQYIDLRDQVGSAALQEQMAEALARVGVTVVEPAPGDAFDRDRHQAVDAVPTDDPALHRTIASIERPGYLDGDRLIRPAQVVVHRYDGAPADGTAGPGGAADGDGPFGGDGGPFEG